MALPGRAYDLVLLSPTGVVGRLAAAWPARARLHDSGDPANRGTARCLCESGLTLALDSHALPGGASRLGVLTPATSLGEPLAPRLRAAGMRIEIGGTP